MNTHLKGSLLIVLSMFIFSLQGILVRFIEGSILSLMVYMELFFFLCLLGYGLSTKKSFAIKKAKYLLFFSGIVFGVNQFAYLQAFSLTTFANAIFSHYTAPLFALVFAVLFLKEKIDIHAVFAILLSLGGIYLLSAQGIELGNTHLQGILFGLVSGLAYGGLIILNKYVLTHNEKFTVMFYQSVSLLLFLSPLFGFGIPNLSDLFVGALIVFLSYILGTLIYFSGLKSVKAQHIGIIAYVEIIFASLFGYLFFSESIAPISLLGGLLIVFSGGWIIYREATTR